MQAIFVLGGFSFNVKNHDIVTDGYTGPIYIADHIVSNYQVGLSNYLCQYCNEVRYFSLDVDGVAYNGPENCQYICSVWQCWNYKGLIYTEPDGKFEIEGSSAVYSSPGCNWLTERVIFRPYIEDWTALYVSADDFILKDSVESFDVIISNNYSSSQRVKTEIWYGFQTPWGTETSSITTYTNWIPRGNNTFTYNMPTNALGGLQINVRTTFQINRTDGVVYDLGEWSDQQSSKIIELVQCLSDVDCTSPCRGVVATCKNNICTYDGNCVDQPLFGQDWWDLFSSNLWDTLIKLLTGKW